jgi:uncharacterized protein YjbJ (UPF0337 family)
MSDREAEGEYDKTKGKVREAMGKATDDKSQQAQGKWDQAKGEVKKAVGKAERES